MMSLNDKGFVSMFILVLRWLTLGLWLFWLVVYWEGGRRIVGDIRQSVRAANS